MYSQRVKAGALALTGINSISTTCYFYYLYFFMQERFGFDRMRNLLLAAALGLIYMFASILCGRFAHRHGHFLSLRIGFLILAAMLSAGGQLPWAAGHLAVAVLCDIGMCFTWPTLEAMVSEGESPAGLQRMVGIYNLVWAGGGALAYFSGGALLEHFGLRSMFVVPAVLQWVQLALVVGLEGAAAHGRAPGPGAAPPAAPAGRVDSNPRPIGRARRLLKMAWLANPFAYLAINTLIAVVPSLARDLHLSPMFAGFFCSVWLFVRVGAFAVLWRWPGWHYRAGLLLAAYAAMVAAFALVLLVPNLELLIAAQVAFGLAVGLIYYSSLYYSMDLSEAKSEHGGLHEAAIGAGSCAGPAIGAVALHWFPDAPGSSAWAVSGMLVLGLAALTWLRRRRG